MSRTQWHVLAASAAINWSTYFIHDVPASLSTPLSEHLSLPDQQYAYLVSLLYAVYAVPNTVLPFFAGPAVQRFGERSVLLGTISSIVTGQLLFALSVATKFQLGMIAGRAFIGLGGEMVGVIGCAIVTRWFQGKRFTLALAINLCAGRLGSVANTIVIPRLIGLYGIVPATWIATALALSVVPISTAFLLSVSRPKAVVVIDESERPLLRPATGDTGDTDDSSVNSIKGGSSKGTSFIITLLPPVYWQLALMCVLSYGCLNTFANSAQRFIASRFYAGDQRAAGSAMSIPYILSGFLVPLFGLVLDKLSSRGYPRALITSNMFLVFAHGIFLARATATPVLPLCLLGIGDALLCVSFWASVVRCLLQVETGTGTETETKTEIETETIVHGKTPSLQNDNINKSEDDPDKLGCEPILSSRDLDLDLESEEDRAGNAAAARAEVIRTLGLGVMTSLMSASAAVVPLLLAMMEGLAGLSGLEIVFVVLAALGCLAAVRLAWMFP